MVKKEVMQDKEAIKIKLINKSKLLLIKISDKNSAIPAENITGILTRIENFAALTLPIPSSLSEVIILPDLLIPGIIEVH